MLGVSRRSLVKDKFLVIFFFVTAMLAASIFLHRWTVTDLGVESFGRLWQYYVSYFDFGFLRRGFLGTFLTESGLSSLISDPYVFAYIFYQLKIFLLGALVLVFFLRNNVFDSWHGYAVVFFSPAFILQSGYLTGTQDLQLLILSAICVLYLNSWLGLVIVGVFGILMHELFMFVFPALALVFYLRKVGSANVEVSNMYKGVLATVCVASSLLIVIFFGVDVERNVYEDLMADRMGQAAYDHGLWSGYFEVFSSVDQNVNIGFNALKGIVDSWVYVLLPVIYAIALAIIVAVHLDGKVWKKIVLFSVLVFPIFVIFVASDFYRWVGMSANVSLLALVVLHNENLIKVSRRVLWIILPFSLLAPLGAAGLERPFPAHQMVLERLF